MKRLDWWLYSVILGSIPILVRLLLSFIVPSADMDYVLDNSDLVSSGLILCIGNIKELELQLTMTEIYKKVTKVIQYMLIIAMSCLLFATYFLEVLTESKTGSPLLNAKTTKLIEYGLTNVIRLATIACFLISITVYHHKDFEDGN